MQPEPYQPGKAWFTQNRLSPELTAYTEPFLNDFFRANFYHLRGRDLDLIVDCGMGLAPLMPALELTPGKPVLAVATHIHADHVGSLHEFAERAGPSLEAQAFAAMADRFTFADMFRVMDDPVSVLPAPGWRAADYVIQPAPLTRTLDEGDLIDLGDRQLRVLRLPGHSQDSIGLFDEGGGTLFSGDAIYDGGLIDDLWCSDREAYRATMTRLLELPVGMVHGGHGASFDAARMREIARRYIVESAR